MTHTVAGAMAPVAAANSDKGQLPVRLTLGIIALVLLGGLAAAHTGSGDDCPLNWVNFSGSEGAVMRTAAQLQAEDLRCAWVAAAVGLLGVRSSPRSTFSSSRHRSDSHPERLAAG